MESKPQHVVVHIATGSILKVAAVGLLLWVLFLVREAVVVLFITVLLALALEPAVAWLKRHRVPRPLGVVLLYLAAFSLLSVVVVTLVPLLAEEIAGIARNFPAYWQQLSAKIGTVDQSFPAPIQGALDSLQSAFSQVAGNTLALISAVFGNLVFFILVVVLTFYFLMQEDAVKRTLRLVTPAAAHAYLMDLVDRMQRRLNDWLRGMLFLGLIVGGLTLVGLWILDVRYYLVLALVAGILELIPYVGPVIAAIPAVFFAASESPWKGLAVLVLFWLIQQLENNLIVPRVMAKAVGLNPVVTILVVLIGAKLAGFVGVLISVPTAAALSVWLKDVYEQGVKSVAADAPHGTG